ncbi:2,3-bisphosphoglycerate-dependent phosphoglycerate mutase [uncultured archaeon]|nr:2,3-bisphosphoglycerate-dependent phosphoglycerate mutase [uncultured archaeon]
MRKLVFKREETQVTPSVPQPGQGDKVVYLFHHAVATEDERNEFGGWTDSPLTELGQSQGQLMQDFITTHGLIVNALWCSDLPRAVETAKYIIPVTTSKGCIYTPQARSWGIGSEISGNVKTNTLYRSAKKFYVEHPDEVPPGEDAESLNASKYRWNRFLTYVLSVTEAGSPNGVVAHGNNIKNTAQTFGFGKLKVGHGSISRLILSGVTMTFELLFVPPGSDLGAEDDEPIRKAVKSGQVYRSTAECVEVRSL